MTYAEFVTSITAKATNGSKGPNDLVSNGGTGGGKFIVTFSGAPGDNLGGSSWSSFLAGGVSRYGTAGRHSYPSQTPFTENTTNNRAIYLDVQYVDERETYTALDRNGFLSTGYTTGDGFRSAYRITQFAWWDAATGTPVTNNPSIGGAPTLYTG